MIIANLCYATVGIHPCSSQIFTKKDIEEILTDLRNTINDSAGAAVAFGEIGLDYDRLFLCPKEPQLKSFEAQLDFAAGLDPPLPLFLHSRAAAEDFARLLRPRLPKLKQPKAGLVHSFTGTVEEMRELVDLGLDIGVNGCSLKTEENLAVVKEIPLDRIQIETDGPWCEIRPSHASFKYIDRQKGNDKGKADKERWEGQTDMSLPPEMPKSVKKEKWQKGCMVKSRNEPCTIPLVAHVVAGVKEISAMELAKAAWENSVNMFGLGAR